MKIRHDFVSNSSSSSFIIDHKSNIYRAFIDGKDLKVLSLKKYVEQFAWREIGIDMIGGYYVKKENSKNSEKIEFVSPQAFARLFPISIYGVLPTTAKKEWEMYLENWKRQDDYYMELRQKKASVAAMTSEKEIKQLSSEEDHIKTMILDKVFNALKPKYGKMKFDYAEIEDNYINVEESDEYDEEDFYSEEDMYIKRFDVLKKYLPFKFWRIFSNH